VGTAGIAGGAVECNKEETVVDAGEGTAFVEGGGEGPREDGRGESGRSSHDREQKGEICEEERRFMWGFLFFEIFVLRNAGFPVRGDDGVTGL
jgi:hypothetical protein